MNYLGDIENYITENYDSLPRYYIACAYTKTLFGDRVGILARYHNGKVDLLQKKLGFFEAIKFKKNIKDHDFLAVIL